MHRLGLVSTWHSSLLGRLSVCAIWAIAACPLSAESPRVYELGQMPNDSRLESLKDLNGYFPFKVPASRGEWEARSEFLKRQVLVATGLWPMPEKTPLNAKIYGKSERADFTIEKVHFESLPGHFVTGRCFAPKARAARTQVCCARMGTVVDCRTTARRTWQS